MGLSSAVISFVGVILSAVVAYFISYRTLYVNTVTKERVRWLGQFRRIIVDCIRMANQLMDDGVYSGDDKECLAIRTQLRGKCNEAILMISPEDGALKNAIEKFLATVDEKSNRKFGSHVDGKIVFAEEIDIQPDVEEFRDKMQEYIKEEWEAIKEESTKVRSRSMISR